MLIHALNFIDGKGRKEERNKIEDDIFRSERRKNSHPSIMSLICRLKQNDYAEVQLNMMNRFGRTLNKHLNGYFLATWQRIQSIVVIRRNC
jgi:hypothetical protein